MQGRVAAVTQKSKRLDEFSRFDSRDQLFGQLRPSSPVAERTRNIRQAVECVPMVGIYCERLLEALECRIEAIQVLENIAAIAQCLGEIRIERQGFAVTVDGLVEAMQALEGEPAIVPNFGILRLERKRLVVARQGIGKPVELP